jgi:transcriptional/translational regulatory protein YebC/TACO1
VESVLVRQPLHSKSLSDEEAGAVIRLLDKMEELDDVVNVFHNMDMEE